MNNEYIIIAVSWIITIGLLVKFIPKNKIREAQVAFLIKQVMTWLFGLSVTELRLIEYPIRLFSYSNKTSFTFEYFVYPSICALFNVHYPENKGLFGQFIYYFIFSTVVTGIEVILHETTDLIEYIHWNWFATWITLFLTFYLSRKYCVWFFKLKSD